MGIIRQANIADLPHIIKLLSDYYGEENMEGAEFYYSYKIKNPFDYTYLLNEDNTFLLMFERIGNFKCQLHIYTSPDLNVIEKKKLFVDSIKLMSSTYSCFLTFVRNGDKPADVAIRRMGGKKLATIPNSGGKDVTEDLYMIGGY